MAKKMSLDEFHSMIEDAMSLQRDCAQADKREEDTPKGWHKEFLGILKNNVEECD